MKQRIMAVMAAALLVAGLPAFASGTVDEAAEAAPVAAGPQYGGVLTVQHWGTDPPNADINTGGGWQAMQYFYGTVETLAGGDFETYGPRGNNASGFESTRDYPETFWKGILAESWEATPSEITINLRRGVMVAPNDQIGLQARELTSADVVLGLDRYIDGRAGPGNSGDRTENGGWIVGVRAEDDYTVVVDLSSFNVARYLQMMERAPIYPIEVVEANSQEFDNLAGTGPFILEEYVVGSSLTFVKNPDYWGTTTIDGEEYGLPFVDKWVNPIIADESARLAALRTGKLDIFSLVQPLFEESLDKSNPELKKAVWMHPGAMTFGLNVKNEYLADRVVRRALMIGLDREAILQAAFGLGESYGWPFTASIMPGAHIPLDELPPADQELFTYNPERAKELLAEAGYPDGFVLGDIIVTPGKPEPHETMATMAAAFWADIGVEVNIKVMEFGAWADLIASGEGYDIVSGTTPHDNPGFFFGSRFGVTTGDGGNHSNYHNMAVIERYKHAMTLTDAAERDAIMKELTATVWEDLPYIPIGIPAKLRYWWPWVQNYYGEFEAPPISMARYAAHIWIDLALKKEMGF